MLHRPEKAGCLFRPIGMHKNAVGAGKNLPAPMRGFSLVWAAKIRRMVDLY